jgi:hypothetical protein
VRGRRVCRRRYLRRQGILPFVTEKRIRDEVTGRAGLTLVVEAFRALDLDEQAVRLLPTPQRRRGFDAGEKLEALVALIAEGGERVEDIQVLAADLGYLRLLGAELPSPDALLDFLHGFHDPRCWDSQPADKKAFVAPESQALRCLAELNRKLVERAASRDAIVATVDHDGTIIESHKRDTKVAYEGTRGFQPLVATWAEEELVLADEFRDGNVAGGEDPLSSARRAFAHLPAWVTQRYYRADSASYFEPLLKWLAGEKIGFTISADMGPELRAACTAIPAGDWQLLERRTTETASVAEVEFTPGDWPKKAEPLRYVAIRFDPAQGSLFADDGPKYLAVVSNRRDLEPVALVRWHWEKAGTIEHVHRVMKDELAAGVMPSQSFGANAAWFRINALTFNLLTVLKRRALPDRLRKARPKRLRFEIFSIPARLAVRQRQLVADIAIADARADEWVIARKRLLALHGQSPPA